MTPAVPRQREQLGHASRGVRHGSSFMGPISSLSIPLPVFLGPRVTPVQERRLGVVRYLRGVWLGVSGVPRGTAFGVERVPSTGILIDCCKFWERCPNWAKIG